MNKCSIAFVGDNDYAMPISVALVSLLKNKRNDSDYQIYIVACDMTSENKKIIRNIAMEHFKIEIISITDKKYIGLHDSNTSRYMNATPAALAKFDLPELIPNEEKIIYLDGDMIIRQDLAELYQTDLEYLYAAVVRDIPQTLFEEPLINVGIGMDYFNSGMMVLNLKLMRETHTSSQLIEEKRNLTDKSLMDQNVFNIVFAGKIKQLPLKYNLPYLNLLRSRHEYKMDALNKIYNTNYESPDDIAKEALILHIASKDKPWKYFDTPLAAEWLYYYHCSPFGDQKIYRASKRKKDITGKDPIYKHINTDLPIIPVVFASNDNYACYLDVAIQSIKENASDKYYYAIYILHDTINEENIERIESANNQNFSVEFINIAYMSQREMKHFYTKSYFSRETYFRWFIPEILSQYDKVIYLDCDLVTTDDIAGLFYLNLNGYPIGGVQNIYEIPLKNRIMRDFELRIEEYINAGVLLIDTRQFILQKIKQQCFETIERIDPLILACLDQDIINIVCKKNIQYFDLKWNFQWHCLWMEKNIIPPSYIEQYQKIASNAIIIHYTTKIKPWNSPEKYLADIFWKYVAKSQYFMDVINKEYEAYKDSIINTTEKNKVETSLLVAETAQETVPLTFSAKAKKKIKHILKKFVPPSINVFNREITHMLNEMNNAHTTTANANLALNKRIENMEQLLASMTTQQKANLAKVNHELSKRIEKVEQLLANITTQQKVHLKSLTHLTGASDKLLGRVAEKIVYFNDFERSILSDFYAIYDGEEFEKQFMALVGNLDSESISMISKILLNINNIRDTNGEPVDIYTEEEKIRRRYIKENLTKSIFKVSSNVYCYKHYLLPINHFEPNVFCDNLFLDRIHFIEYTHNKCIMDVGAYIGDTALILSPITNDTVYSFEPVKKSYELLQETIRLNNLKNVVPIHSALGAKKGQIEINIANSASSIYKPLSTITSQIESVPMITLDDFVVENSLSVGIIKVDIEGYEQEFLKGAEQTIKDQCPILLISIYHNVNDFFNIKPLIESWNLGYKFKVCKSLDHSVLQEALLIAEVR